ncbi:MAG: helix-turn-helix domain-containing protein [Terrimicrobiaceae bacterium]
MPQWLEERSEVSEKTKKLYAYLTYFAGGKGYAWPSFKILADKLHCSRRHVVRLVQELSAHRLITVTNVSNPEHGHCANYYRFLWHPWMQTERDASFVLATPETEPLDYSEESAMDNCQEGAVPSDIRVTSPPVTSQSPAPSDMAVTSPSLGDIHVTPLVTPMSPQENNRKRTNNKGKVPVTFSQTVTPKRPETTASPPPRDLSDTTKIVLERRIAELRKEIGMAARKGLHDRAVQLHTELAAHQSKLGFTPDDPPRGTPPSARKAGFLVLVGRMTSGNRSKDGNVDKTRLAAWQNDVACFPTLPLDCTFLFKQVKVSRHRGRRGESEMILNFAACWRTRVAEHLRGHQLVEV